MFVRKMVLYPKAENIRKEILGIVAKKPCSPFDVLKIMEKRHPGEYNRIRSKIYYHMPKMAEEGLLHASGNMPSNSPHKKTIYSITQAGRKYMKG